MLSLLPFFPMNLVKKVNEVGRNRHGAMNAALPFLEGFKDDHLRLAVDVAEG